MDLEIIILSEVSQIKINKWSFGFGKMNIVGDFMTVGEWGVSNLN